MSSHNQSLTDQEVRRLKLLPLAHLRADIDFRSPQWPQALHRASRESQLLNCSLHLALFLTEKAEEELKMFAMEVKRLCPSVSLWLIFSSSARSTPPHCIDFAKPILAEFDPSIPIAAGTNANFAELNRARPPATSPALPCFSINPQVHAFDDRSLIENLEAQPHVVQTARQFSSQPIVISPITLKPRFNVVATTQEKPLAAGELPASVDTRQMSLCAAAWTLGSLASLSSTELLHSLTYYETTGWRGIIETAAGPPSPARFPSIPGSVFPVFYVFASLSGYTHFAPLTGLEENRLAGFVLFDGQGRRRILLANLESKTKSIILKADSSSLSLRTLDETNAELAMTHPEEFLAQPATFLQSQSGILNLTLKSYAFAWLDSNTNPV